MITIVKKYFLALFLIGLSVSSALFSADLRLALMRESLHNNPPCLFNRKTIAFWNQQPWGSCPEKYREVFVPHSEKFHSPEESLLYDLEKSFGTNNKKAMVARVHFFDDIQKLYQVFFEVALNKNYMKYSYNICSEDEQRAIAAIACCVDRSGLSSISSVYSNHQSSGFGRYLIIKALACTFAMGVKNVELMAMKIDSKGLTVNNLVLFYKKFGFIPVAISFWNKDEIFSVDMSLQAHKGIDDEIVIKPFDVKQELLDYARSSYCTDVSIVFQGSA